MSSCEVTTVVATRDRWEMLSRAALPSALSQEDVDHEVIVVDDGSRDATSDRLAGLAEPRLRVIRHDHPLGVAKARNAGIAAARGTWVGFLDDDDLWSPRKLRLQLDAAAAADAEFAYARALAVDEQRRPLFGFPLPPPEGLAARLLRWNHLAAGGSNVVVRGDLVRRLGGFDERLFQLADWDLWIRLALAGKPTACPETLVGYVVHDESMLLIDRRDVFDEMDYLVSKHRPASEQLGVEFDRALFSRWVARGHRRAGRRVLAARTYLDGARRHRDAGAVIRAFGALLGERANAAWRVAAAAGGSGAEAPGPEPEWLARYR
jgi:glycosyltransferase involved in cell wall biosynthesis